MYFETNSKSFLDIFNTVRSMTYYIDKTVVISVKISSKILEKSIEAIELVNVLKTKSSLVDKNRQLYISKQI